MAPDMYAAAESLLAMASGTTILTAGTRVWQREPDDGYAICFTYRPRQKIEVGIWWNNQSARPDVRLICGLYPNWVEFGSLVGNGFDRPQFQGQGFGTLAVNLAIEALQAVLPASTCVDGALVNVSERALDAQVCEALSERRREFWRRFGFRLSRDDNEGLDYILARVGDLARVDDGSAGGRIPWSLSLREFTPV